MDVSVAGPNVNNREDAEDAKGMGVMALRAEERKLKEVNSRWQAKPNPNCQFTPFAIENTRGLGNQARELLYNMLDVPSPLHVHPADSKETKNSRDGQPLHLHRIRTIIEGGNPSFNRASD